jgi:hypothetical protein
LLALPEGSFTRSISRLGNRALAADEADEALIVCQNGQLISRVKLEFKPHFVSCTGNTVWAYSHVDSQTYRIQLDDGAKTTVVVNKVILEEQQSGVVYHIAANARRVALCYADLNKVCVYAHSGELLHTHSDIIGRGPVSYQLNGPCKACLDDKDFLYIADHNNKRIVVVRPDHKAGGLIPLEDRPVCVDVSDTNLYVGCDRDVLVYKLQCQY